MFLKEYSSFVCLLLIETFVMTLPIYTFKVTRYQPQSGKKKTFTGLSFIQDETFGMPEKF